MVFISMASDQRDGKTIKVFSSTSIIKFLSIVGSIETWGKQSRFYLLRYSAVACHKLSHLIHGYSYLVPLEILEGYKKLRRFPGTKVNLNVLLGKPDITYRGTLNTESLEPSCRISPEPRTMLKILYFSGGHQFSQISLGIKFLYDRVENLFIDWGGIICDRGDNFSKFIDRGSHRGASHRVTWTGCNSVTTTRRVILWTG